MKFIDFRTTSFSFSVQLAQLVDKISVMAAETDEKNYILYIFLTDWKPSKYIKLLKKIVLGLLQQVQINMLRTTLGGKNFPHLHDLLLGHDSRRL